MNPDIRNHPMYRDDPATRLLVRWPVLVIGDRGAAATLTEPRPDSPANQQLHLNVVFARVSTHAAAKKRLATMYVHPRKTMYKEFRMAVVDGELAGGWTASDVEALREVAVFGEELVFLGLARDEPQAAILRTLGIEHVIGPWSDDDLTLDVFYAAAGRPRKKRPEGS